jgi:hypothetical protein
MPPNKGMERCDSTAPRTAPRLMPQLCGLNLQAPLAGPASCHANRGIWLVVFIGAGHVQHGEHSCSLGYPDRVSPTVLRVKGFRFYFFSREEARPHVHVQHAEGEAKFWIDPAVELHANYGLKAKRLAEAQKLVEGHVNEIRNAWAKHFPG